VTRCGAFEATTTTVVPEGLFPTSPPENIIAHTYGSMPMTRDALRIILLATCLASLACDFPKSGESQQRAVEAQQLKDSLARLEAAVRSLQAAQAQPSLTGRYTIVNGTPTMTRNIMLLDTHTGRTWLTCAGKDVGTAWCDVPSGFAQAGKPE
jgi:hypothetical protein